MMAEPKKLTNEEAREIGGKFLELGEKAEELRKLIGPVLHTEVQRLSVGAREKIGGAVSYLRMLIMFYEFMEHLPPKKKIEELLQAMEEVFV